MTAGYSRRSLLFAGIGGSLSGAAWSSALVYSQRPRRPRIDVIGERDSQFVFLDTSRHRVLFALGPVSEWLSESLFAMIGPFRRSIDLVIAADDVIAALRPNPAFDLEASMWIALPTAKYVGSPYADRTIESPTSIRLSTSVTVSLDPGPGETSTWLAVCARGTGTVAIAPKIESALACRDRPSAVIAPTGNVRLALRKNVANVIVCNSDSLDRSAYSVPWLRTYAGTPAKIELWDDRIQMPSWLEQPID